MKKGISLIVLVITIIVMIILAAAIIIALNNNGIIVMANEATDKTNIATVKEMAELAWSEAYLKKFTTDEEFDTYVKGVLQQNNITEKDYEGYIMQATTSGVKFVNKSLNPSGKIPQGAVYYVGVTSTTEGDYTGATATYTAGQEFPGEVKAGDVYVYNDYEYRYNMSCNYPELYEDEDNWEIYYRNSKMEQCRKSKWLGSTCNK